MRVCIFLVVLILTGCSGSFTENSSVESATGYIGLTEWQNRAELTAFMGIDPSRTEWCAAFVNAVLELDNIPSLNDSRHPAPLSARSFLSWGERIAPKNIKKGDLVIFPRGSQEGWQGHVGFYVETVIKNGHDQYLILGGNQSNSVRYDLFNPKRALGVRRWTVDTIIDPSLMIASLR
jgi:uncharacterized protein (TIGR02594 family)